VGQSVFFYLPWQVAIIFCVFVCWWIAQGVLILNIQKEEEQQKIKRQ
jgi:hypothetical protein